MWTHITESMCVLHDNNISHHSVEDKHNNSTMICRLPYNSSITDCVKWYFRRICARTSYYMSHPTRTQVLPTQKS